MKISCLSAVVMAVVILASCAKEADSPVQESGSEIHENSNKSKVKIADAAWYKAYRNLLTKDNVLYKYIMDGTLSETELIALNNARINGTLEISDFSTFLSSSEANRLLGYFNDVNNHVANTEFNSSYPNEVMLVHIDALKYWQAKIPNAHWAKATDCEEEAAQAAVQTLGGGIATAAGASLFSGPAAPVVLVGGVVGSIFGSVAVWAISMAGC
jgi:hypothetical protein